MSLVFIYCGGGRSKGNFSSSAGKADITAVNFGEKSYSAIQINQLFKEL